MRSVAIAAIASALAACGGEGGELASGNSQLSQAAIDAALGPSDQSMVEDAIAPQNGEDEVELAGNDTAAPVRDAQ